MVFVLCILVAVAGCTGSQIPENPATAGQSAAGTPSVSSTLDMVPTENESPGDARMVYVNIEKDHLGVIHATFQGGPGLIHVKKIGVTVNRADGEVKTADLGINLDDTTQLEGTKQSDRVLVYVTLDDGKAYKIYDDLVAFKPR